MGKNSIELDKLLTNASIYSYYIVFRFYLMKIVKTMMKRCVEEGDDQYEALLELRNTPKQDGSSPAEQVFKYEPRTLLPKVKKSMKTETQKQQIRDKMIKSQYDKTARDMTTLRKDQPVFYQNPEEQDWHAGIVKDRISEISYLIEGENGGIYTRNRRHLRPKPTSFNHARPAAKNNSPDVDKNVTSQPTCLKSTDPTRTTRNATQNKQIVHSSFGRKIKPNYKYK